MEGRNIIMSFTVAPGLEDLEVLASSVMESIPDELLGFCDGLAIAVEEIVDEAAVQDLDLEDAFDLLALYKSGKQISPGIEKKTANDEDVLLIFRRPVLDMWCETGEDLSVLIRQVMIEELGRNFEFSESEINEMTRRHYQGML